MNAQLKKGKAGMDESKASGGRIMRLAIVFACGLTAGVLFNLAFHANVYGLESILGGVASALLIYWMS